MLVLASLAGCEDAGKRPVQAHVPALDPPASAAQQKLSDSLGNLPLRDFKTQPLISLAQPTRGGIPYLIEKVNEKFASGEANYKAGHLAAARRDFDDAVDWILESGYDPNSDPKLSELFHQVTDTVYAYELQAFRAGDGFSEAPAVPAAIDEVAEMTFPVDPKLKERAEDVAKSVSHDLPLTVNDVVVSYLNFFQTPRGRAIVENGTAAQGKIPGDDRAGAEGRGRAAGPDLSGAGGERVSAAGAVAGRGAGHLAIRAVARERVWIEADAGGWTSGMDPEKATRAAAQHLRDLYGLYGDWYLAMAAYNCGPGNVQKGIERTGYADFWELYKRNVLPRETKNYVPIILALTLIAKDAAHYGISVDPEQPVDYGQR